MGASQFGTFVRYGQDAHPARVMELRGNDITGGAMKIATACEAYQFAYMRAEYNNGVAGSTGTIAEKEGHEVVNTVVRQRAELEAATTEWDGFDPAKADIELDWDCDAAADKWGDAACIIIKDETGKVFGWLFYGHADH